MNSGASKLELNYPTYVTIAKLLNIKQNNTMNPSKSLTVANQTEVPILHYVTKALNTTIEDDLRQFTVPFAVADKNYKILGIPFFEEYIQNILLFFVLFIIVLYNMKKIVLLICYFKRYCELAEDFTLQFKYKTTTTLQNLHHFYPKITHTSRIFVESILKHKYV